MWIVILKKQFDCISQLLLSPVRPVPAPNNPLDAELFVAAPDIEVRNKTWLPSQATGVFTKFFIEMPQLVLPTAAPET